MILKKIRGDLDPPHADFLLLGVVHPIDDYQKPVVIAGQIFSSLRLFLPDKDERLAPLMSAVAACLGRRRDRITILVAAVHESVVVKML
jgi:hypothetical protein